MLVISYIHYTSPAPLLDALAARLEQLQIDHQTKSLEQSAAAKRRIQRLCVILEYGSKLWSSRFISNRPRNWLKFYWHADF